MIAAGSLLSFAYIKFERQLLSVFIVIVGLLLCSCSSTISGRPERLYSVSAEGSEIKRQLGVPDFTSYSRMPASDRVAYRNNYISARMYAIDLAYTDFEARLTSEAQQAGFAGASGILALNTAATLFEPAATKTALSAVSAGLVGLRSAYDESVLMKNTVDIIQTQMRANRANVAALIYRRMRHDDASYPLAMALSDVEEYYRAGTITGGIVKAQATVSAAELDAVEAKAIASTYALSSRPSQIALAATLAPNGNVDQQFAVKLRAFLRSEGAEVPVSELVGNPAHGLLADRAASALGVRF